MHTLVVIAKIRHLKFCTRKHIGAAARMFNLNEWANTTADNRVSECAGARARSVIRGGALNLDAVMARSKEFQFLVSTHDPVYEDIQHAIDIVKDFIVRHRLIIYGGTAIDYALRLRGDKIYPDDMLKIPDLDFYSPQNVEHAYTLADALYHAGFTSARVINAMHIKTMRVDVVDGHFIADMTYIPPAVFATLPYIEYEGMRCIHPDFQRADLHSSLSFPYDNAPREVIFDRWQKDIKRFNKLNALYPVGADATTTAPVRAIKQTEVTLPLTMRRFVFCGFLAYAVLYREFARLLKLDNQLTRAGVPAEQPAGADDLAGVIPAEFSIRGTASARTCVFTMPAVLPAIAGAPFAPAAEFIHFDIAKAAKEIQNNRAAAPAAASEDFMIAVAPGNPIVDLSAWKLYEPYINLVPRRYTGPNCVVYSSKNRLLCYNSISVAADADAPAGVIAGTNTFRIPNVQYLLKHFISMHFATARANANANAGTAVYLMYYHSLMQQIAAVERAVARGECPADNAFIVVPNTYGADNINLAREVALNRLYVDLDGVEAFNVPVNYYPERAIPASRPHPEFDPEASELYREQGREITGATA